MEFNTHHLLGKTQFCLLAEPCFPLAFTITSSPVRIAVGFFVQELCFGVDNSRVPVNHYRREWHLAALNNRIRGIPRAPNECKQIGASLQF